MFTFNLSKPEVDALQFSELRKQKIKLGIDEKGNLVRESKLLERYCTEDVGKTFELAHPSLKTRLRFRFERLKSQFGIKDWGDIVATLFLTVAISGLLFCAGMAFWSIFYYRLMK